MKPEDCFERVVENAIDFLEASLAEFKMKPKYSVIHFAAALELFFKARLMKEHWSVIVAREADYEKFTSGDFVSVSLSESVERLGKIAGAPIPKREQDAFSKVAKHRNKIIHFYHTGLDQQNHNDLHGAIASEHLTAWYYLYKLISVNWKPIFDEYSKKLRDLDLKMRQYKDFLAAIYETLRPEIEREKGSGSVFVSCYCCGYPAAEANLTATDDIFGEARCRVCESNICILTFECPVCGNKIYGENEYGACNCCKNYEYTPQSLAAEWSGGSGPSICRCNNEKTVIEHETSKYVCLMCFEEYYCATVCGDCGNAYAGIDPYENYNYICPSCYRNRGWDDDY